MSCITPSFEQIHLPQESWDLKTGYLEDVEDICDGGFIHPCIGGLNDSEGRTSYMDSENDGPWTRYNTSRNMGVSKNSGKTPKWMVYNGKPS